jgi:hypothetical protein
MNVCSAGSGLPAGPCYKSSVDRKAHFIEHLNVGAWYLSLAVSLFLVLVGLYIHWSVVLVGLLLPFIPMISFLVTRRAKRKRDARADTRSP